MASRVLGENHFSTKPYSFGYVHLKLIDSVVVIVVVVVVFVVAACRNRVFEKINFIERRVKIMES
jgi:hypothetical protein